MTQDPTAATTDIFTVDPTWQADEVVLVGPDADPVVHLGIWAFDILDDGATWDTDLWDDGTLNPGTFWAGAGRWVSIADRVRGLTWSRGAESALDRPRVGTADLTLDNRDGALSPWFVGDGPYKTQQGDPITPGDHVDGPIWLRAGAYVRFGVFVDDTHDWYPWFSGRIIGDEEATTDLVDGYVTLSLEELTTDLGGYNGEQQALRGGGDTLTERVHRLINDAGWESGSTIDSDTVGDTATFQATAMANNRLTELYLVGDSVGMRVLCGTDGQLRVTPPQPDSGLTADLIFSNAPDGSEDVIFDDAKPYASTDRIVNTAIAARVGSTEITIRNKTSIAEFGPLDPGGSRDDLIVETDAVVQAMLQRMVDDHATDYIGIASITLDVDHNPVDLPAIFAGLFSTGLEAMTPFNIQWTHVSGNVLETVVFTDGFTVNIVPIDGETGTAVKWTATVNTAKRI